MLTPCGPRPVTRRNRASLDGEDVDQADVGGRGQKVRGDLSEGLRDLTVQVGLTRLAGLERVEDAEGHLVDPERVPGDGAGLGDRQRAARLQERAELVGLARLGLQACEQPESYGH